MLAEESVIEVRETKAESASDSEPEWMDEQGKDYVFGRVLEVFTLHPSMDHGLVLHRERDRKRVG